jgi:hypothetical protein
VIRVDGQSPPTLFAGIASNARVVGGLKAG